MPVLSGRTPWLIAIACVAILIAALFFSMTPIPFRNSVLSEAVDLIAGLFVVVLLVERSLAVINNIWFGEERQQKEEMLRDLQQREAIVRKDLQRMETARESVAMRTIESMDAGPAMEAVRQTGSEIESLRQMTGEIADDIARAKVGVIDTDAKESRVRLLLGFVIALLVAAAGIRAIEPLVDLAKACVPSTAGIGCRIQLSGLRAVDILLTAGLIAGGSSGLSMISQLIGSSLQARPKPQS